MRSRASARASSRVCRSSSPSQNASRMQRLSPLLTVLQTVAHHGAAVDADAFRHRRPGMCLSQGGLTKPQLRTKQDLAAALTVVAIVLAAGLYALAQQPYQLAAMDESKRDRGVSVSGAGGKFYVLPATLDTTQWGWLDPKEPPKLVINSGDTVAIETMMHAHNAVQPGTTLDDIVKLRLANPGGGPHSVTRPLHVSGGAPRGVLAIRIKEVGAHAVAANFHLPGAQFPAVGQLAPEFPQGFVRY